MYNEQYAQRFTEVDAKKLIIEVEELGLNVKKFCRTPGVFKELCTFSPFQIFISEASL